MTLTELLAAIYDETQYTSSPSSVVTTRLTRFINEGVQQVITEPGMSRLLDSDDPVTVASVAGQARYVVLEPVAEIRGISETTNDIALDAMSMEEYRRLDPDPASRSGVPTHYVPIGRVPVAKQPADTSTLYVKSTSASDVGTAYIEGIITTGAQYADSFAMSGTTAVPSNIAFAEVTDFYVSASATGLITLLEDSGSGTELAKISLNFMRPRYYGFYLWPTPNAVVTYNIDYRRRIIDMVNATDEPPIPQESHPMLIAWATYRELDMKGDADRAQAALARFMKDLSRLKYRTQTLADELPVAGRRRTSGMSRLGAWFPADMWR